MSTRTAFRTLLLFEADVAEGDESGERDSPHIV